MRATEFLNEAISITQYESNFIAAFKTGFARGFAGVANAAIDKYYPDLVHAFTKNCQADNLINFIRMEFSSNIASKTAEELLDVCHKILGKDTITSITFARLGDGTHGMARHTDIYISWEDFDELIRMTIKNLIDLSYKTSKKIDFEKDEVNDTWTGDIDNFIVITKMFSIGDKQINKIIYGNDRIINVIIDTFVHELVHVVQYKPQLEKNFDKALYRSYLQKTKDELEQSKPKTDQELTRWNDLYFSSPQEIGAFAHNVALTVIRKNMFDKCDIQELPALFKKLTTEDIADAIRKIIGSNRFKNPANSKEIKVYNRYLKLAYLEIQRYVDSRLKTSIINKR